MPNDGAAQRVLRVFPHRTSYTPTDQLAYIGLPPLVWQTLDGRKPEVDGVHISVCFSWDVARGYHLLEAWEQEYPGCCAIGGPALGDGGDRFTPGMYVREGVTFTSRGCPNRCPWCLVPGRSGALRLFDPVAEGWRVNDDNFLACPPEHRRLVYAMLARQPHQAVFAGGLDARLLTDEIAAELREVAIHEVWLACDTSNGVRLLDAAVRRLAWLARRQIKCYALIAFDSETPEQAEARLRAIWEIGAEPFPQLYQPPAGQKVLYPRAWNRLAKWCRPAVIKMEMRNGRYDDEEETQATVRSRSRR